MGDTTPAVSSNIKEEAEDCPINHDDEDSETKRGLNNITEEPSLFWSSCVLEEKFNMAALKKEDSSEHSSEEEFVAEEARPKRKEALIWKFFTFPNGEKKVNAAKVTCKVCGTTLSRGDPTKKYSFGNARMVRHVKTLHPRNYERASCARLQDDPPPAVSGTSTAPSTAPSSPHPDIQPAFGDLIPDIQPNFRHIMCCCIFCDEILAYGEQSISLICQRQQEHHCPSR
ncbi:uncharacterized protein LOC144805819 isoform X2 [Lissotriton helveticus]